MIARMELISLILTISNVGNIVSDSLAVHQILFLFSCMEASVEKRCGDNTDRGQKTKQILLLVKKINNDEEIRSIDQMLIMKTKLKHSPVEFWIEFLKVMNQHSNIYQDVKPSERRYLHGSSGIAGVIWGQTIGEKCVTTEIYLHHKEQDRNKIIYDELKKSKIEIENSFGEMIDWARLDDKIDSRIKRRKLENVNCLNQDDWNRMIDFMVYGMLRMEKAFKEPLAKVKLMLATE